MYSIKRLRRVHKGSNTDARMRSSLVSFELSDLPQLFGLQLMASRFYHLHFFQYPRLYLSDCFPARRHTRPFGGRIIIVERSLRSVYSRGPVLSVYGHRDTPNSRGCSSNCPLRHRT